MELKDGTELSGKVWAGPARPTHLPLPLQQMEKAQGPREGAGRVRCLSDAARLPPPGFPLTRRGNYSDLQVNVPYKRIYPESPPPSGPRRETPRGAFITRMSLQLCQQDPIERTVVHRTETPGSSPSRALGRCDSPSVAPSVSRHGLDPASPTPWGKQGRVVGTRSAPGPGECLAGPLQKEHRARLSFISFFEPGRVGV